MPPFVHLHNHTEFSLLDGAAKIENLTQKACDCGMSHIAITDHGNMFGVPKFAMAAQAKGVKPIVGCEFYIIANSAKTRDKKDKRYHQIMWAMNKTGYHNLVKLASYGYTDGYYYKPRIDKEILRKHSEGIIASTCCLASEVNRALIDKGEEDAEKVLKEYMDIFGKENYYVEVQRHTLRDMDKCNAWLQKMALKHGLKVIATNDVHYVDEEDAHAHDLLLALQTQSDFSDPKRFRFTDDHGKLNPRFFFKTQEQMLELFHDIPEALDHTVELAERCSFEMNLTGDMILPQYKVPEKYKDMDEMLKAMVWERASNRYTEITSEISERIEVELRIIREMGYAGYFLIVQSFTTEARNRGVYVGPGRGSAAGSLVAYVLRIIDIDPLKYDLLFERFLNPERVSPPDIDIDFDDEGRQEVIDYVVEQYGRQSVSQVITYGTMGVKTAIRDVGRTLGVPLAEVNRIAKLVPDKAGMTFEKALDREQNPDNAEKLQKEFKNKDPEIKRMLKFANTLEGTARHTGVHACAVIIAPQDITNYVPVAMAKGGETMITQYDGPMAEKCGMLKMDFLGLRTLSIIKTAIQLVKQRHNVDIDPDKIDLTDKKTFELYQRGDTYGTFQFESDGMRKYLRMLKPTTLEDLIAMNALYRPGPMDNIPSFVARKHGKEKIKYPHPMLEPILKNTYGIMVYQEQIMQVARTMGGYSLGGADILRRAMGKKKADVMAEEKVKFLKGAAQNGVDEETAEGVFALMAKFAEYGFNKSHAAAYSVLAFKTAYIKAHYPAEYMASVLTHNVSDIGKITGFIKECQHMGIAVLPPDINDSQNQFSVNEQGAIRFGLEAIKGVGSASVEAIIEEREKEGPFSSIFDMTSRVPSRSLNRKTLEALVYAGAMDCFGVERFQYFLSVNPGEASNVIDRALSYGSKVQSERDSPQVSLFGEAEAGLGSIPEPAIPRGTQQDGIVLEAWTELQKLKYEKEVIGFFLSGHPLEPYERRLRYMVNFSLSKLAELKESGKAGYSDVRVAGIVTSVQEKVARKSGNRFMIFALEDFSGSMEMTLFGEMYEKYLGILRQDEMVFITGRLQGRYYNPDELEFNVSEIRLLTSDLCSSFFSSLSIEIKVEEFDIELLEELERLIAQHKGSKSLRFQLRDPAYKTDVPLISNDSRVDPNEELLEGLHELGLGYRLNRNGRK